MWRRPLSGEHGRWGIDARACSTGGGWLDASGDDADLQADKRTSVAAAEKRIDVTKEHALGEPICMIVPINYFIYNTLWHVDQVEQTVDREGRTFGISFRL